MVFLTRSVTHNEGNEESDHGKHGLHGEHEFDVVLVHTRVQVRCSGSSDGQGHESAGAFRNQAQAHAMTHISCRLRPGAHA